jgi:hypothetical protein
VFGHFHDTELFNLGVVVNQAINNPDGLKKMDPSRRASAEFGIDLESVPAMLRPVKKKKAKADG